MFRKIDWISFTFNMPEQKLGLFFDLWARVETELRGQFPLTAQLLFQQSEWHNMTGRAPYQGAAQRADNGVTIFASNGLPHALVEITGRGCDALGSEEAVLAVLEEVSERLTRVDVAVDIHCQVLPDEFAAHRTVKRFKAWSEAVSSSGHTVYIGGRKSDRYARVYRYYDPHPRAAFLRVEHVVKSENARLLAEHLRTRSLDEIVDMLGNTFGWEHPVWERAENSAESLAAWRPERRESKTVFWLHSQVVPAIVKLAKGGVIDLDEFLTDIKNRCVDKSSD